MQMMMVCVIRMMLQVMTHEDSDGDGLGDNADVLSMYRCNRCNYNSSSTLNTDNTVCTYVDGM